MSGRSVFGPLLLISLGALFLYANFHPELSLQAVFAHNWPWVLVVWGGVRVVETILAHFRWRPTPPPLGAGSFLLVVLLCVLGSAAHAYEEGALHLL